MAIVDIYPKLLHPLGVFGGVAAGTSLTVDNTGESVALVGNIVWKGGTTSATKTISSAGGAIYIPINTVTFSNAGSTFTVGLQDTSSGIEDGTFDVSGSLVGVTDTISATRYRRVLMETGTKTITYGDRVAIVAELVSRGGSDTIAIEGTAVTYLAGAASTVLPCSTQDTGSGPARRTVASSFIIEFDDGTVGWAMGVPAMLALRGETGVSVAGTATEYANIFTPTYPMRVTGMWADLEAFATTDTANLSLYSDPYGSTPTVLSGRLVNGAVAGGITGAVAIWTDGPVDLSAGVVYALGVVPGGGSTVTITYQELQTGNAALKAFSDFEGVQLATRAGGTGAFANGSTTQILRAGLVVSGLDDGTSSGSPGGGSPAGGGGGPIFGGMVVR